MSRTALVVGLGRSGRAAARLLVGRSWSVIAVDSGSVDAPELADLGVDLRPGTDAPVPGVELVVKSPGVPSEAAPVAAARSAGIPVWSEIELAARELSNPLIGITGTNGKTTTTELTAHLLRGAGIAAEACGNQGRPVSDLVDEVDPGAWLVVECSSFQLEDAHELAPRAAALLNVTPDHLDRHDDLDAYLAAKLRLFRNQRAGDLAILPEGVLPPGAAAPRTVTAGARVGESVAWGEGGVHVEGLGRVLGWEEVPLRGAHNRANALVAAALAAHAGARTQALAEGLATFAPVAHRLEPVGTTPAGVLFVNDSKATNPAAAIAALDAYGDGPHMIAGGRGKDTSFAALARAAHAARARCYLVGETASELAAELDAVGVAYERSGTVERAVADAVRQARAGEVVLLAPACASFDQFASYEERGEAFRAAAREAGAHERNR